MLLTLQKMHDVIEVLLPKSSTDVEVSVFPTGGIVGLFFIKSSSYLDGTKLSYRPGSVEADPVPLANAHLYSGTGQVSVLENPPTSLFLSNSDSDIDVTITIVAARDATP